ncbi:CDP-diacylglycerol--glycerol-3-phosphate 3-phosphatidyltransferase [Acetanaerobacterium elongatum]|uniref:CDP-diacylglycerol--glycerol-3-phosphate 3-phosphatidyltransferase n=1 Tax=Acetanaerobacterium elongatum TaxID=258515 RepID=A0A1G9UZQ6_9FIRM|nr:CDP-diacylglycerol--glycerol-3-phosphate 3-phosphatidyltransferase [Acetanaerobacterium elongatum]SDM65481.1 CDP-diacylglycerol--glycerol-3-phosphate 3-phosphatidyltransferase [Acetanaerobacterium elongatum]
MNKLNTPNRLTLLRIVLVPAYMVFLLLPQIPHNYLWAAIMFSAAAYTDYLDGHLARKHNMVTNFGKFLDPLADKMLVTAALICFVELGFIGSVVTVVIITREFMVTSLRLVAAGAGNVIAAGMFGKVKTVMQIIVTVAIMLMHEAMAIGALPAAFPHRMVSETMMWVVAAVTVASGIQYLWLNRRYINPEK